MTARSAGVEELIGGVQSSQSSGGTTFSYARSEAQDTGGSQEEEIDKG
jgi:hypothetical protein